MNIRTRDAGARAAMWVQLVDVLAQDRGSYPPDLKANAFRWLEKWRDEVPERRRLAASAAISGRAVSPELIDFFARDNATVAQPVLARCPMQDARLLSAIPGWPTASRAFVAQRTDVSPEVARGLASLGPQTLALPNTPPLAYDPALVGAVETIEALPRVADPAEDILDLPIEAIAPPEPVVSAAPIPSTEPERAPESAKIDAAVAPINELLARIERYQRDKPEFASVPVSHTRAFIFETNRDGLIHWVEGAPRGALVGLSLSDMALPGECGVDGQAAGAFRKRARFDHARLSVAGHGPASGDWLISGEPVFESDSGRFLGYQGQARRLVEADAEPQDVSLMGGAMRPASVRQLVHELRTPLNAIRGFAEMIEGQFLGPVADPYRNRAARIMQDSAKLLRVFEDLDSAARLESGDFPVSADARSSLVDLVRMVFADAVTMTKERDIALRISLPEEELMAAVDESTSSQILGGFVELLAGVAAVGEAVHVSLRDQGVTALLEARPVAGETSHVRWEWAATVPDGSGVVSDILPLGLGYKFRLLARMAQRIGGSLSGTGERLTLILPLAASRDEALTRG